MALRYKIVSLIFLSCILSSGIFAEELHKGTSKDRNLPEFTLPEITVKGDDSMYSLKMDVIKAEEHQFDIFNSLNSTDDFDITCKWYSPVGTRIKKWGCEAGYLKKAVAADSEDYIRHIQDLSGNNNPGSVQTILVSRAQRDIELARKRRALNKEMIALAAEHPELAIAMVKANAMQQFYKAEHRKRYKNNILVRKSKPDEKAVIPNEIDILAAAFLDHRRGVMSDKIWARWDSTYRKIFHTKTYRIFWTSADKNKRYTNEFVKYINSLMSDDRQ